MNCRHCGTVLDHVLLDLGFAPPSNAYLTKDILNKPEKYYPLRIRVCEKCWLVQTEDYTCADDIFNSDYSYFSSVSSSWLRHARHFSEEITRKLKLSNDSLVIEIGSNDGYLLRNFISEGIPCIGIDPATGPASRASSLGIRVIEEFFTEELGKQLSNKGDSADLVIGNNVYAHVPDINGFTRGLKALLKTGGIITLEFPHLMELIRHTQFDTVYHEHFSYLSLFTACSIFKSAGLRIYDVEKIKTHGGSLRIYGCHENDPRNDSESVDELLHEEQEAGLQTIEVYKTFQSKTEKIKDDFLIFLIEQKREGKKIAAYGAAAKGNTLLNYAGIKPDLLPYIYDAAESKQGKYMPGSHIPILPPSVIHKNPPDFLIILPWNIKDEINRHLSRLEKRGTKFLTVIPEIKVL